MRPKIDSTEFARLLWLSGHAPGLAADLIARRCLGLKVSTHRTSEWVVTMFKLWDVEASKVLIPVMFLAPE